MIAANIILNIVNKNATYRYNLSLIRGKAIFVNSKKRPAIDKRRSSTANKKDNANKEFLGQNQPCAVGQTAHIILEIPVKKLECHVFPKKRRKGRL
jgi:hypothetical protein